MARSVREAAAYGLGYLGVLALMLGAVAWGSAYRYRKENEAATLLESYRHGVSEMCSDFREMCREIIGSYKKICDKETS